MAGRKTYDTVTEALNGLKDRGFLLDFNLYGNSLVLHDDRFDLNDFKIVEVHRFEGNSDPADEAVVYAIQSVNGQKGVLVNGYGISANQLNADMIRKIKYL